MPPRDNVIAARLSSALTSQQVAACVCDEVVSVLRAFSGSAALRVRGEVHIVGVGGPRDEAALAVVSKVPLDASVPIAEAVRTSIAVWCGSDRLRLIAVTGYGQESDRARSRAAGFDHHLVKPITLESLIPLLARDD